MIGSRELARASDAAERLAALAPSASVSRSLNEKVAKDADPVFVMVPYAAHRDTLAALGPGLQGKTVVDVVAPLAFFCKDGFQGRSPGRALCGVQVVDRHTHAPIGFLPSLKRNLILYVPLMPVVIAFRLLQGHRFGDGWANTTVVWKKYAAHPVFTGRTACAGCQYDLTGNTTGTCPECGTPIAPPRRAAA